MDYLIIAIATLSGLYFHWWLFVRSRRWTDRFAEFTREPV